MFCGPLSHGRAKAGRPARTYTQQLCADTRYSLEDLPGAIDDRDGWRERQRESGRSVPAGRHDDDDDDDILIKQGYLWFGKTVRSVLYLSIYDSVHILAWQKIEQGKSPWSSG